MWTGHPDSWSDLLIIAWSTASGVEIIPPHLMEAVKLHLDPKRLQIVKYLVTLALERVAAHRITSSSSIWSWKIGFGWKEILSLNLCWIDKKCFNALTPKLVNIFTVFSARCTWSALTPGLASLIALTSSFTRVSSRFCSVSAYLPQIVFNN